MRNTAAHLFRTGRLLLWGVPATGVLVEALLDRCADGDDPRYRQYRDRYRDMAKALDFEGHIGWAEEMP